MRTGIHPDRPFYSQVAPTNRWWVSERQRIIVLTFPTIDDAKAWDENPTFEGFEP